MKFIKSLFWAMSSPTVEKELYRFCQQEYRPSDVDAMYKTMLYQYKQKFING